MKGICAAGIPCIPLIPVKYSLSAQIRQIRQIRVQKNLTYSSALKAGPETDNHADPLTVACDLKVGHTRRRQRVYDLTFLLGEYS